MSTKNIFAGFGVRSEFVNLIYTELMKRKFVSYADILAIYCGRPKGYYDKMACNSEPGYGELKKAFPEVLKALTKIIPDSIEDNGQSKGKAYRYIGEIDDPLGEERKAVVQKSLEDYVLFCKASAGIMPASWFSSFFENTQLLLDTNREAREGENRISSGFEQNLTNIDLLPVFYKAISNKQVLQFSYQRFGQEPFVLTFHPQYLKELRSIMVVGLSLAKQIENRIRLIMYHWIESLVKSKKLTMWNTSQLLKVSIRSSLET